MNYQLSVQLPSIDLLAQPSSQLLIPDVLTSNRQSLAISSRTMSKQSQALSSTLNIQYIQLNHLKKRPLIKQTSQFSVFKFKRGIFIVPSQEQKSQKLRGIFLSFVKRSFIRDKSSTILIISEDSFIYKLSVQSAIEGSVLQRYLINIPSDFIVEDNQKILFFEQQRASFTIFDTSICQLSKINFPFGRIKSLTFCNSTLYIINFWGILFFSNQDQNFRQFQKKQLPTAALALLTVKAHIDTYLVIIVTRHDYLILTADNQLRPGKFPFQMKQTIDSCRVICQDLKMYQLVYQNKNINWQLIK